MLQLAMQLVSNPDSYASQNLTDKSMPGLLQNFVYLHVAKYHNGLSITSPFCDQGLP